MNASPEITFSLNENAWEDFVYSHPQGNIFQSPLMFRLFKSVPLYQPGIIALKDHHETILGVLSYNIIRETGLKKIFSARSIITGGPLVKNNDPSLLSLLLQQYQETILGEKVIYSQVRNLVSVPGFNEAFLKHQFRYNDHLTIHIDLTKDIEILIHEMHKKRYSNIKRMMKKGISIRELAPGNSHDLDAIITKTYNRINIPRPPAALFLNAFETLKGHVYMLGAFINNVLIGARIYLLYKETIYDWYAVSDLDYSNFHPNDILPWNGMLWAKEKGYTLYDFAGAGQPEKHYGVRDYKIKFGGKMINTGRYLCVHQPLLYQSGKAGMKLLQKLRIRL